MTDRGAQRRREQGVVQMRVEHMQPFVSAAAYVLKQELNVEVERGDLSLTETDYTTKDVTVLIGVTGELEGTVLFGTTEEMAMNIVYEMTGERKVFYDETCESAIAELGNVISGRAMALLEDQGIHCTISPPTVITGRGTIISAVNMRRLIVPLHTRLGTLDIAISLRAKEKLQEVAVE